MKAVKTIVKVILILAAIAAATYLLVTYWDQIMEIPRTIAGKIRKALTKGPMHIRSEYDDYADWDEDFKQEA